MEVGLERLQMEPLAYNLKSRVVKITPMFLTRSTAEALLSITDVAMQIMENTNAQLYPSFEGFDAMAKRMFWICPKL